MPGGGGLRPRASATTRVPTSPTCSRGARLDHRFARAQALRCDVVCCVTPGTEIVVDVGSLRAGLHLNMLGADGPGKAEASVGAVASCALFCDEWEQASHGGELTGAVNAGLVTRDRVTELGAVLAGDAPGRPGPDAVTLFDSTGLAIQDLAVAVAAFAGVGGQPRRGPDRHALSARPPLHRRHYHRGPRCDSPPGVSDR